MTHDELLIEINRRLDVALYNGDAQSIHALRAVVELHKPSGVFCRGCGFNEEYNEPSQLLPCPTIQVIEKELG